jgi:peptidoglycan hydrolase-like protein with peptidoglycan-binding domain
MPGGPIANLVMFDSISADALPADGTYFAGYVDGEWADRDAIQARFPKATVLSIAVFPSDDADCLDVETGDATPADAAAWYERQRARGITRPCLYADADTMEQDLVPILTASGIARSAVRLWSAHYTHAPHICGPSPSCGAVGIAMDGTQWTDLAAGGDVDESLLLAGFFDGQVPAPAQPPSVLPWQEAVMNALPTLRSGAADASGQVEFVHRAQALAAVIGAVNHLPAAEGLALDGSFGPKTGAAIGAVQSHFGIAADSVVGPATWGVLVTGSAS